MGLFYNGKEADLLCSRPRTWILTQLVSSKSGFVIFVQEFLNDFFSGQVFTQKLEQIRTSLWHFRILVLLVSFHMLVQVNESQKLMRNFNPYFQDGGLRRLLLKFSLDEWNAIFTLLFDWLEIGKDELDSEADEDFR